MTPPFLEAILVDEPGAAERELGVELSPDFFEQRLGWIPFRLDQMILDPSIQPWLTRVMLPRHGRRQAMGTIGFHGPPNAEQRVEIGYEVLPAHRGQGLATEACRALFDWAAAEHGITRFRASVSPGNAASLAVVRKLGLQRQRVPWDQIDGEEAVFEIDGWPAPARS
jgi:ribosomal-protein-alanine N-acetyltransferase